MKSAMSSLIILKMLDRGVARRLGNRCVQGRTFLCRRQSSVASMESEWVLERAVPKTLVEYKYLKSRIPVQPDNPKVLRVAVIGEPNVGKSTLINQLVKWKVCSVSKKVHTTRHSAKAILIDGSTQVVFLDTPGIVDLEHSRKHALESTMVVDPEHSLINADTVAVMVDASDHWRRGRLDDNILRLLSFHRNKESLLIINKVDLLESKRQLLECIHALTEGVVGGVATYRLPTNKRKLSTREMFARTEALLGNQSVVKGEEEIEAVPEQHEDPKGWRNFAKVFMISALNDDGVVDIRNHFLNSAKPADWMYPSELVTDQNPHEIATMCVREKILNHLSKEVPYNLNVSISMWDLDTSGVLHCVIEIKGQHARYLKQVIGEKGKTIQAIAAESRRDLASIFRCEISLKLIVTKA